MILVARLAGPLASYGTGSRFGTRATDTVPSLSALVGLCASSLGRPRGEDLSDLASLPMAVRVDTPGSVVRDYHTVNAPDPDRYWFLSEPDRRRLFTIPTGDSTPDAPKRWDVKGTTTQITERDYL